MRDKLKKLQIKGFVVGVMVAVMLGGVVALANPGGVMREVFYGVNIVVNGNAWNPPADQTPFITDGRTFLPVRGISELLDVPVDWDGATRTVYIGTIPQGMPFFANVSHFQHDNNFASNMNNRTVNMLGSAFPNSWAPTHGAVRATSISPWRDYNLNAAFNTLSGTIGRVDGSGTATATISFIGDGRTLATFDVDGNTHPTDISVDVRGVLILRIVIDYPSVFWNAPDRATIAFTDALIQ